MIEAVDILMCVGEEHYPTPQHFIDEADRLGVSKRLPLSAPPKGLTPGVSRVYFRHERAVAVFGSAAADDPVAQDRARDAFWTELRGMRDEVVEAKIATWQHDLPDRLWHKDSWLYTMSTWHRAPVDELFARHQVRFAPGIFGYVYFTGFALVTDKQPGEQVKVPSVLEDLPGLRAIRVSRIREDDDEHARG